MKALRLNFLTAALAAFFLSALLLSGTALAQQPQGTPSVNDVAKDLYCPLCAGLTVDVCDLEVCDDMKQIIDEKLAAGESPEEIQAYFVEQYGQKVLGKPSTQGFHLTAWLMPFVVLGLAAISVFFWLRGRAELFPSQAAAPRPAPSDDYAARLERDLQRLDE